MRKAQKKEDKYCLRQFRQMEFPFYIFGKASIQPAHFSQEITVLFSKASNHSSERGRNQSLFGRIALSLTAL
jgi:hypothetical protein